ncbi:MAG: 2-dehydro-3-deoxy-D-gluconate 5-dehydrogenase KduD [Henriciella sp.]
MALGLAEAGANIALTSTNEQSLSEIAEQIHQKGRTASVHACDLSNREGISNLIASVDASHRHIDILVNNAGIIRRSPAAEHPASDWDEVLEVNLFAPFALSQAFGKRMIEEGQGKIINIASLLSFSGGINVVSYASSKGAIAQMTKAFANEWASKNVQVNAIAPGYFATDNTYDLRNDSARSKDILGRIPAGRWGAPEDLQGALIFLASAASNYVNGHVLLVDGGWMAR